MNKGTRIFGAFLTLVLGCGMLSSQQVTGPENSTQNWLVELSGLTISDGGTAKNLQSEKASFRSAAAAAGIKFVERKSFDTLWNGIAIQANPSSARALSSIPGVKAVFPDEKVTYDPTKGTSEIEMASAVQMTGVDLAQNELGLSGKGVKVAVIDTGLDYGHSDLGACGAIGYPCRVAKGWDFVGDKFNADSTMASYDITLHPDADPMDCAGHGTHVAGIIGADGDPSTGHVRGVAPKVTFYAYRVFGCEGSTLSSVMIDAMERALADGAQVLNMSIGSTYAWPSYPTATAADRLVKRGVSVVTSIGNSGASGLFTASAPGVGDKVIGVASFENTAITSIAFAVNGTLYGYFPATGAPVPPTSGDGQLLPTGTPTSTADACVALPANSLAGKIALIRRGTCSFYIKSSNAQAAGAVAVVLYNNQPGTLNATVAGTPAITIPVVGVSAAAGTAIYNAVGAGHTTLTWTDQTATTPNPQGNLISSFSSYGLAPDLSLKPDIGAPGGNIWSTYPRALGSYASLSGTSMASPHVAGSVALLLEANPKLQASKIRDILQTTSSPRLWQGNPGLGFFDQVARQGAGMLNIYNAVLATTRVTPGKLALGASIPDGATVATPATRTITIQNLSNAEVTYTLSAEQGLSVSGTFAPAAGTSFAGVSFSSPTVTVPAGSTASVNVTFTAPTTAKRLYGGWVVITPSGDGQVYRVPFAGFSGSFQSIQVLAPTLNGFPWLAQLVGGSLLKQGSGTVFTLANGDVPYVLLHLDQQSAALQLQLTDAISGKDWHFIDNEKDVVRNNTASGFFAIAFNGTTWVPSGKNASVVPNGQYKITVRVLKPLGDPANPSDWELWDSPVFTIARP